MGKSHPPTFGHGADPATHPRSLTLAYDNDPLYRLRHALAGLALALLLSVLVAAFAGRWLGDWFGDSYGARAGIYAALLLYAVVGAVVLFVKVAQHETRPLGAARVLLWFASLWLWPVLLLAGRAKKKDEPTGSA